MAVLKHGPGSDRHLVSAMAAEPAVASHRPSLGCRAARTTPAARPTQARQVRNARLLAAKTLLQLQQRPWIIFAHDLKYNRLGPGRQIDSQICIYQYGSQSILVSVDYLSDVQDTAFRDFSYFEDDCKNNDIPSYTFIEPCYSDVIITPSIRQIVNIPTMTWRRGSVFCCQSTMPFVLRKRSGKVHFY